MNVLEAASLIDHCVALGCWTRPADLTLAAEQAEAWAEALDDVQLAWAMAHAAKHQGPYSIRPSWIRGAWVQEEDARRERERRRYNERACPWASDCRCTHGPGECNRGWLDDDAHRAPEDSLDIPAQEWCPECWKARNVRRSQRGKDPLPVGVIGP